MSERINGTTPEALMNRYFGFPEGLMYQSFQRLPTVLREQLVSQNRILQTDTYNRTMEHISGPEAQTPATYTLQMRRSPHGYIIAMGMRPMLETFSHPITQAELDFAADFYTHDAAVPYFNKAMWQNVIDNHGGYMPIQIDCVPEGTALLPGDPVIRVSGPNELVAHFEPLFHRLFYPSMVATTAHVIGREFPGRFIEVGKRGTPTEDDHLIAARAMLGGGGIDRTSNDAAAAAHKDLKDVGTLGHRYVQCISIQEGLTERDAFIRAIESTDAVSLLIDLVDSYRGIDMAIELKEMYRHTGKKISIRLDSGDVDAQTVYALREYKIRGFTEPSLDKVMVEGIETIDDMRTIDALVRNAGFDPEKQVLYGGGRLLVAQGTTRSDASTGFKLTQFGDYPTMKFSDSPGKRSIPGVPTVYNTSRGRVIGQVGERIGSDIFVPAYRYPGTILLSDDMQAIRIQAERSYRDIQGSIRVGATPHSSVTQEIENAIQAHYQ